MPMCTLSYIRRFFWSHSARNPDHAVRPTARSIVQQLLGPLLKLPLVLPACSLGAPLEEGRELYQDLQTKYKLNISQTN